MTRQPPARYIPENSTAVTGPDCIAYKFTRNNTPMVIGYSGKQSKPQFYYRFNTEADRERCITSWFARRELAAQNIAEHKAARRTADKAQAGSVKVGDIFDGSWGYDQTNIEWWEVTRIVSAASVEIAEIKRDFVSSQQMSGWETPRPHEFTKEPRQVKRVQSYDGKPYLNLTLSRNHHIGLTPWNGKPRYSSNDH